MSEFTIKFPGTGTGPFRTKQVPAAHDGDVGRFASNRLCASRVFVRGLVCEGVNLRPEVDRSRYRHAAS